MKCAVGDEQDYCYIMALLTDVDYGALDGMHPGINSYPQALKSAKKKNPDCPTYQEAMCGPHKEDFELAMVDEIDGLEKNKTWKVVPKSTVPEGVKVIPGTWAFVIKRYPDGRHCKFKARYCAHGDCQVEGIDYDEKYSPVVSWSTVRMMLCMTANQGLATKQVDFSQAFTQVELSADEEIYIQVPRGFESEDDSGEPMVLKLKKSLYGLVQAPLYWNDLLKAALERQGLKPSAHDPCMFVG